MGLFKRISDIISANLGEMAESFEDPEKMLKQAVREMEKSIQDATKETAKALAGEKKLVKELAHNVSQAKQWQSRAEKAVEEGDDDLARRALSRKQEHEKLAHRTARTCRRKDCCSSGGHASKSQPGPRKETVFSGNASIDTSSVSLYTETTVKEIARCNLPESCKC